MQPSQEANNDGSQSIHLFRAVSFFYDWRSQYAGPAIGFAVSVTHDFR